MYVIGIGSENVDTLDYYNNPKIKSAIRLHESRIRNDEDRKDCAQEIFSALYDFMPLSVDDAVKIVDSVAIKFRRRATTISNNEIGYAEAGLI